MVRYERTTESNDNEVTTDVECANAVTVMKDSRFSFLVSALVSFFSSFLESCFVGFKGFLLLLLLLLLLLFSMVVVDKQKEGCVDGCIARAGWGGVGWVHSVSSGLSRWTMRDGSREAVGGRGSLHDIAFPCSFLSSRHVVVVCLSMTPCMSLREEEMRRE
ncbi:hypothetical protein IWZ01DRAFT_199337 [Phyllosticta capitalensis]